MDDGMMGDVKIVGDRDQKPAMSRKQFMERAVERSGLKRKAEARAAVEATLAVLGEILVEGSDVHAPPLGRVRVIRSKDGEKATTITLRIAVAKGGAGDGKGGDGAVGATLANPVEAD